MNAIVAARGLWGVPIVEELVRACWGIDSLYYDAAPPGGPAYEEMQRRVSFRVRAVPGGDWNRFWKTLEASPGSMLFLVGCPEPEEDPARRGFDKVYVLHWGLLPGQAGPDAVRWALARGEKRTGVTLYRRLEKPYCGDLLLQAACPLPAAQGAVPLEKALTDLAVKMVRAFWEVSTQAELVPQCRVVSNRIDGPWPQAAGEEGGRRDQKGRETGDAFGKESDLGRHT